MCTLCTTTTKSDPKAMGARSYVMARRNAVRVGPRKPWPNHHSAPVPDVVTTTTLRQTCEDDVHDQACGFGHRTEFHVVVDPELGEGPAKRERAQECDHLRSVFTERHACAECLSDCVQLKLVRAGAARVAARVDTPPDAPESPRSRACSLSARSCRRPTVSSTRSGCVRSCSTRSSKRWTRARRTRRPGTHPDDLPAAKGKHIPRRRRLGWKL